MRFVAVTPRLTPESPTAATNRAATPRRATPPRYRPQPAGRFPSESDGHKKMTVTQRIVVTGRVQGIGYRAWTMGAARDLGVRGWVRNSNGSGIEILATGDDDNAFADFNHAIELDGTLAESWANQALVYERKGDLKRAYKSYAHAVSLDPKYQPAKDGVARTRSSVAAN